MATDVSICSNALLMLGQKAISSLTAPSEGNADRVTLAANLWPEIRDDLLRAHPWNCAIKRVILPAEASPPAFGWTKQFRLPSDFLRVLTVGDHLAPDDYRIEGRLVLANLDALPLRYVYQNTDVGSWDSALVTVATLRMAAVMAYPITSSASLADQMNAKAEQAFKRAKAADGQEEPPEMLGQPRQTWARY